MKVIIMCNYYMLIKAFSEIPNNLKYAITPS